MTGNPYEPQPHDQRHGQSSEEPRVDLSKGGPYAPPPNPYAPPPNPYAPYGSTPYGTTPYGAPLEKDRSATTAMVLGIVAVAGAFICGVTILISPVALVMGLNSKRRIDASGGRLGGRSEAQTGFILGIIGTVLLALAIVAIALVVILALTIDNNSPDYSPSYGDTSVNALAAALPF